MKGYIYKLTNKMNGKGYVGLTTLSPQKRFEGHVGSAVDNSPFVIHKAIRKYGIENFELSILQEVEKEEKFDLKKQLAKREIFHIAEEKTHYLDGHGYNMTIGGEGVVGKPYTEEQKKMRSRQFTDLWKENWYKEKVENGVREFWKDNEEARKNMSKHSSARKRSKEQLEAMRAGLDKFNADLKRVAEKGKKISKFRSGRTMSKETKEKISNSTKGVPKSEKHNKAVSKSLKEKYKNDNSFKDHISSMVKNAHTPEANAKRSVSKRKFDAENPGRFTGNKNPNAKKIIYIPENKIFNTRNEAAEYAGCHPTSIRRRIIDPRRSDWDYYKGE